MGIQNKDGALYFATGIDNSGLRNGAKEAGNILHGLGNDAAAEGDKMKESFNGASAALNAIGGTVAIGMLGKEILDTTAKFEKFGIVLRNTLGNTEGDAALSMISEFAATTPFQLDEVTGSFIKMANQGFVPTREEMVKLGDVASTTGKTFDMLTEAVLDAQTGEFERLKEFGIKASKEGDKVTFSFREQKTTVDYTNDAIRGYILSLGDLQGITGANALISASLTGQISNLEDKLAAMYNTIGTANKGVLYDTVGLASSLVENYETVGKVVLGLVAVYGTYKAAVLITNAVEELGVGIKLANAMAGTTMTAAQVTGTVATNLFSIAQAKLNATILANPYALAAAAVVALGIGIYALATSTTDAEKAHEKLAKTAKDSEVAIRGEEIQVDTLFARLKAAKKGTDEYKSAKDAIMSQYGQYLKGLGDEKTALNNVALAQRTITEEIIKSARARAMTTATADASNDLATTQGDISEKMKKLIDQKFGKDSKQSLELFAKLKGVIQQGGHVSESFSKLFDETVYQQQGQFGTTTYVDNELKNLLTKSKQAKSLFSEIQKDAEIKFGSATTTSKAVVKDKPEVSESPEQEKKRLAAEKKAANAAEKKRVADAKLAKQIEDGKANAEKDLQGLLLDLQNQTAKLQLKNSEDNLANRIAQIDQEEKEEVQKVTDKEVAIIEAYNKAHKGDKNFKPLSTTSGDVKASVSTIDSSLATQLGAEELKITNGFGERRKEATKQWGDEILELSMKYAEERIQLAYDYNKEIEELTKKGLINEAALLTAERDKKTSIVSKGLIEESDLYKVATDEKLNASKETTDKLIADIKRKIAAEQAAGKLSKETAKQMNDDIDKAQVASNGNKNQNNPFAQLGDAVKGNSSAKSALKAGKLDPKMTTEGLAGLEDAAAKATSSMAGAAGAALGGVQDILGSVVGGLDSLGMLTKEEKETADQVVGMVGGAATLAMGIASGNPMQIIQGSVDMLVNGFKLFDTKTKDAEKDIKKQQELIDSLKKSYDDLEDSVSKAFSTTKAQLVTQEMQNLKAQNEAITKQIADENSKKKTDNDAIKNYEDAIDANKKKIEDLNDSYIEALTGTDVMSAIDSLANAYADVWTSGEDQAKKSFEMVRGWIKTALIDQLKNKLQPEVAGIMKSIASAMEDGTISQSEQAAIDVLTNALDAKAAQYKNALEPYLEDSKKSGVTGELKSAMTEATGSDLVGLWNMTAMDIRSIKEFLLFGNKVELTKTVDISASVGIIMAQTIEISKNTLRTANNTDGLKYSLDEMKSELTEIKRNTKSSSSRG